MKLHALAVLAAARVVASLQVAPGSPCANVCIDSASSDVDDPDASNTDSSDIVCDNEAYTSTPGGKKFQRCLTCLQTSGHEQTGETDQQWFIYNLRFAFDYCILGYPNGTASSNPCITSESCGSLSESLEFGIENPAYAQPYQFCTEDDDADIASSSYMDNCQTCLGVDSPGSYLVNFLVAIRAGCQQQPAANMLVGLSDTVFTSDTITILTPSSAASASSSSSGSRLSIPAIAGIVIGILVAGLIAAACIFMQIRRRRNRRRIQARRAMHQRASTPSFRCRQASRSPSIAGRDDEKTRTFSTVSPSEALGSNPPAPAPAATSRRFPLPAILTAPSPASATSTRSDAHLLAGAYRPYTPSDYPSPAGVPGLAISTAEPSPRVEGASMWERPGARAAGAGWGRASPGVQMPFPPPPGR